MSDDHTSNPEPFQRHDTAFKWLITKYPNEFFALFFRDKHAKHIQNLDKKFISKLEQYKAPVEADLLMAMEIEIDEHFEEVAVVLELKSTKADIRKQLHLYCFHALAMFGKTVWPIALFTDDEDWQPPEEVKIPIFYSSRGGFSCLVIDLIKISQYQAEKLSEHSSLFAKLVALKADDRNISREQLVKLIIESTKEVEQNDPETLMLVKRFLDQYSKIPPTRLKEIKEAAGMIQVASTITEHYLMEGERKGKAEGKIEGMVLGERKGKIEGKIEGKIDSLKGFFAEGFISEPEYLRRLHQLQLQLETLQSESD